MLDDLKWIHEKDPEDTLGIARRQSSQLSTDFHLPATDFGDVQTIVLAGMGGSALSPMFLHTWPGLTKPLEIVRDYDIPAYVNEQSLFIASSYSGNTEETLSALSQAEAKGARIVVIAAGGKLQEIAEAKGYVFAQIPRVEQPRYAVLAFYRALLDIFAMAKAFDAPTYVADLAAAQGFLATAVEAWGPEVPTANNPAKQLAQEMIGKSVVVYAGPKLFPAAYKWKISCNENAKHVAWCSQIPEFNHNEFVGWSKQPVEKPYVVIDLRSSLEHERVQKRFVVTERMLSGMRPASQVVEVQGSTLLEQLLWATAYGDFVTLYLALLNGVDPAPVDLVERFKKALND